MALNPFPPSEFASILNLSREKRLSTLQKTLLPYNYLIMLSRFPLAPLNVVSLPFLPQMVFFFLKPPLSFPWRKSILNKDSN